MSNIPTLLDVLFEDRPFFEGATMGWQGNSNRHVFMICALQLAIQKNRPVRLLEVGSWIGSSALSFAQGIRRFSPQGGSIFCVDPWGAYFKAEQVQAARTYDAMDVMARTGLAYGLFLHNTKSITGNVTLQHHRGTLRDLPSEVSSEPFDMIYIDGSHYYEDVAFDLRAADKLLRQGGILCGDDLELQIGGGDYGVDRAVVDAHLTEDACRPPVPGRLFHPGVTLAVQEFFGRQITATLGFWYVRKTAQGYEDTVLENTVPVIPEHLPEHIKERCRALLAAVGTVAQ